MTTRSHVHSTERPGTEAFCAAPVRHVAETGSTNRDAMEWARKGAPDGAVVAADFQTEGRGRLGRSWFSARGQNILASVILRGSDVSVLSLAAGVACARTVEQTAPGVTPTLKWPNDVLVGGRKLAGILVESSTMDGERVAVVGFGVNLNQAVFAARVDDSATSLLLETGRRFDREEWLDRLRNNLADVLSAGDVVAAFEERMALIGDEVEVYTSGDGRPSRGVVEGIADDGALILDTRDGRRTLYAGDITFHARQPDA